MTDGEQEAYTSVACLVGLVTFFGCWYYAVVTYGWFLGGGLGWIPALCIAVMAGFAWPLLLIGAVAFWFILKH